MLILKNKLSIINIIFEVLALAILAVFIYLAISNPYAYIGVTVVGITFLFTYHKSNFMILKNDGIIYRKYFIWKNVKFNKIASIYIVRHSFITRTSGTADFHNKNKTVQGYIFFAKPNPCLPKNSFKNSVLLSREWDNFYFGVQFKDEIIKKLVAGGYNGEINITSDMADILGENLKELLPQRIKLNVIDISGGRD